MPEFSLNSDIFCKNSLEIRCLNKFRFDIRPLYLNFYSLENFQFFLNSHKLSVSSVLEWWRHLTGFFFLLWTVSESSTWWEFTPGECLLWLKILWGGKYLKRCWRANQDRAIKLHADRNQHLCNYRRFDALTDCTLYPTYVTVTLSTPKLHSDLFSHI